MAILMTGSSNSYVQLLTVLLIFVVVLGATALTTKWIAGYQKEMGRSGNIELLDAVRLGSNKYIQIVRVGSTYVAIAVCKDAVTVLCEIPEEDVKTDGRGGARQHLRFQEIWKRVSQTAKETPEDGLELNPLNAARDAETLDDKGERSDT